MTIETVVGLLAETYRLLRPETILHADELMKERRTNEELRNQLLYTADGLIYLLQGENRTPTLAITRGSSNPLFQDFKIDEYCQQLRENKNYRPTPEETSRALQAEDTVLVDLTKLELQGDDQESRHLTINTQNYNGLNSEQQKLAERVYGKGQDFGLTMRILADAGILDTRVFVLNPDYVCIGAKENSLGRASWLSSFSISSYFSAYGRIVNYRDHTRGVRRDDVARSAASESEVPRV